MKDPYSVLGVSKEATESEIKRAYYRKAKEFHPDHNKSESAEDEMKEVNSAYEILSDPSKKKSYDNGYYDPQTSYNRPYYGNYGGFQYDYSNQSDDFFEELRRRAYERQGKRYETKTFNLFPLLILAIIFFPVIYKILLFALANFLVILKLSSPYIIPFLLVLFIYSIVVKRSISVFFRSLAKIFTWLIFAFFMIMLLSTAAPLFMIIMVVVILWYIF